MREESSVQLTGSFGFWTELYLETLEELRDYIHQRATAVPISGQELLLARTVKIEEIDEDSFPEDNEFTASEAHYLSDVIDYCIGHPLQAPDIIGLDYDNDEDITEVTINFPAFMEPPAELR